MQTVQQLFDALGKLIEDGYAEARVVLSKDGEGNAFHFLQQVDPPQVCRHDGWYVETVWNEEGTKPLSPKGHELEEDEVVAIILWP